MRFSSLVVPATALLMVSAAHNALGQELLAVTTSASSGANGCDPAGVSGAAEGTGLPVANAPAGALIARLQADGVPVLVGGGRQLKLETPGHLFFGVNAQGTPPCAGSFAVKVHLSSRSTLAATGNALTASPSPASGSTEAQTAVSPTTSQNWPARLRSSWRDSLAPGRPPRLPLPPHRPATIWSPRTPPLRLPRLRRPL
jgi:hypothetical protein